MQMSSALLVVLTFRLFLAKETLGHFGEEFLGRAGGMELWHHYAAVGGELVGSETLQGGQWTQLGRRRE